MKKLQNYLMKPDQLRKKLQNPRFRQDFIDWTRSNISIQKQGSSKQSRSRSPVQKIQHSLQLNLKKTFSGKQNTKTQTSLKQLSSKHLSKTPLMAKNHLDNNSRQTSIKKNSSAMKTDAKISSRNSINKQRYNSYSSVQHGVKKERSVSHIEERKVRQKYSYRTRQGVQISNPNKVNQDSLVIKTNLAGTRHNLYAVADGHGAFGHLASQYLVKNVSKILETHLKDQQIYNVIPKTFHQLQKGLTDSQINVSCSGSTFVSVFIDSEQIICANVGDSRAILARQIDRKSWELIYLSQDHKPSVQSEKKRIIKNGGRIHPFRDENGIPVGPMRVWLPNQNIQGLAMSRSFGDNVSKTVGVTCDPEIIKMKIDKRDRFLLIASDGVWEFISNQEVLQLIVPYYKEGKLEEACDALSKLAYERWTSEDDSVVDDITFVLIFLSE